MEEQIPKRTRWVSTVLLDIDRVLKLHADQVARWHDEDISNPYESVYGLICEQHADNFRLWHEEDSARSPKSSDSVIADVKRRIDKLNQSRNDGIERIDDWLLAELQRLQIRAREDARINTETPGSAVDRLSILALRLYHLEEQSQRQDVDESHRQTVADKIAICELQRQRLSRALADLLNEIEAGSCRHEPFRQLKMYNDRRLNPHLYQADE